MRICLAQLKSVPGDVKTNIERHKRFIQQAAQHQTEAIFFPELSLTGYEPTMAPALSVPLHDSVFDPFQDLSDQYQLSIGVGFPHRVDDSLTIGMAIFQPRQERRVYEKGFLHKDEVPFFSPGKAVLKIQIDTSIITPAICYESLLDEHARRLASDNATIYLASVAKPQRGIGKAVLHYPKIAKKHTVLVLMVNATGIADNFFSAGQSAVWNTEGQMLKALPVKEEGLLIFDTLTKKATTLSPPV